MTKPASSTPMPSPSPSTLPPENTRAARLSTAERLARLALQKRELEALERELRSAQREEHARLLRRRGAQIVRTVAAPFPELDIDLVALERWLRTQPGARSSPTTGTAA